MILIIYNTIRKFILEADLFLKRPPRFLTKGLEVRPKSHNMGKKIGEMSSRTALTRNIGIKKTF